MKVRVFVPATDAFESARFALLDGRGNVLREGTAPLAEIPRADATEVILPVTRVLFARLALPRVNAATIRELLPFAVEDRLLGDPAHIHAVAGNRGANGETTVAIVDRDWFSRTLGALRHAGLKPRSAWSESALAPRSAGEWNLAWGPQSGILVDDRDVAVAFDRGDGADLPLALRLALDEAAARGERPRAICVRSEGGEALPDLERWSADSGVIFMKSEPWEWVRLRAPEAAIDLLQDEFAQGSASISVRRIPRAAVILVGVIAVLQLAFVAADAWRLERERQSLEVRREAIFRTAFPEAKAVVDPDLQMRRNLAELRRTRGLASDDDFLAQLTRAAREGATPVRAIEYASGRLQVRRDATAMGNTR